MKKLVIVLFKERGINQKPTIHLGADLIVSLKGKIARESSIVLVGMLKYMKNDIKPI